MVNKDNLDIFQGLLFFSWIMVSTITTLTVIFNYIQNFTLPNPCDNMAFYEKSIETFGIIPTIDKNKYVACLVSRENP